MIRELTAWDGFVSIRWKSSLGLLAVLLAFFPESLRAEDPPIARWMTRGGGQLTDRAGAVAVDSAGNVYFAGTFQTNGTFGNTVLSAVDLSSLFLAKLNSAGVYQWAKSIESGVIAVSDPIRLQFDTAGKLLLMCTPAGDGGVNPPLNQLLVGKYEPATGNTIWSRKIKSTFFADTIGRGLAQDAAGNIYVAGSFSGTTTFGTGISRTTSGGLDAFLLKLNSVGTTMSLNTFGQPGTVSLPDDELFGVTVDATGNIYAVGEFANTVKVGTNTLISAGDRDMVLIKYDSSLNVTWARRYGSTGADYGRALTRDSAGNLYMLAFFESSYVLGTSFPSFGYVVGRMDSAGDPAWTSTFGTGGNTSGAYGFTTDISDNLFISAGYNIGKFNSQGTMLWAKQAFTQDANDLAVVNNTNLFIATTANGVFTLDNLSVTNALNDALVVKMTIPPVIPAAITVQPTNKIVALGGNTSFAVSATGTTPLAYQWRLYSTNLPGANATTFYIFGAQLNQVGNYTVVVSNPGGAVTSQVATLTVTSAPPSITAQPLSLSVLSGSSANFSVGATGNLPLTYQWRFYATNLPGAISQYFSIPSVTSTSAGPYTVVVSNGGGAVTSQVATLTVTYNLPVITRHPTNLTVLAGSNAVFNVLASGSLPLTYQWQKNGQNFGPPGLSTNALYLNNVQPADSGSYRIVVTNPGGTATSSNALLTVQSILSPGPPFQWVKSGGGEFGDFADSVTTDGSGNIYISGTTSGRFLFGGLSLTNNAGPFLMKINSSGNAQWINRARNGNGQYSLTDVATDGTNLFMAGSFAGNTALIIGDTTIQPISFNIYATFVVKYDLNGNVVWVKRIGPGENPRIAPDGSGGVFLTGAFGGSLTLGTTTLKANSGFDVYVTRLDSDGNFLWAKNGHATGNGSRPNSLKVDAAGNLWISGYFSAALDFGGAKGLTNRFSISDSQCFVARLQRNGDVIWQTGTTNYTAISLARLEITGGTNAVVAGFKQYGAVTWSSNDLTGNLWIGRMDGAGQMLNSASAIINPTLILLGLAVDKQGNSFVAFAQGSNSIATFGNSAVLPHKENSRALLARWNADGSWGWARTEGAGALNTMADARALTTDPNGSIIVFGDWSGTNKLFGTVSVTNTGPAYTEMCIAKIQATTPIMPVISSTLSGSNLLLSWPSGPDFYVLETTPVLGQPFGPFAYTSRTNPGTGQVEANLPVSNTNAFFILRKL